MTRTEDWRRRLGEYVDSIRTSEYDFGQLDCWLFCAGCVEAMTGVDPAQKQRGRYKTAKSALSIIRRAKTQNIADFAALQFEEQPPVFANIGDIMAIPTDDAFGFSLGVLNGERVLVVTPKGIDTRDRGEATRSFRV